MVVLPLTVKLPFTTKEAAVTPLVKVDAALTVKVLFPLVPRIVLLLATNKPDNVDAPLTIKLPFVVLILLLTAVIPDNAVTAPDNVVWPLTRRLFDVNPLVNVGVAFTVNVLFELVPNTVLLFTESKPLIDAFELTCKVPLIVICAVFIPVDAVTKPDKVDVPVTRRLFDVNPLVNVGVAFTVNVLFEPDPIVALLNAFSAPLIVAPVPTSTEPLIVSCEVVIPLLNIGVAFIVNVLFALVPIVALLSAFNAPLIVAPVPTTKDPLTVTCEANTPEGAFTKPDNVVGPLTTRVFEFNPLVNVGVAFTVNVLFELVPIVELLVTESNPLIVALVPTSKEPLTVTCVDVIPLLNTGVAFTVNTLLELEPIVALLAANNDPLIVAPVPTSKEPLTVTFVDVIPLLNTGFAFTVNTLLDEEPIVALLDALNAPLIVAVEPTTIEPLTETLEANTPEGAFNKPDNVVGPLTTRLFVFNPLVNVGVAFTVNELFESVPIVALLNAFNTPLIVVVEPTNKTPLTVRFGTVVDPVATTDPFNVVGPLTVILFVVNPLVNVGDAFTVKVFAELEPRVVLLLAVNIPLIVAPVPDDIAPLTVI
ncbi:MAG: hypothetical protein EBR91_09560 [Flavobacteriia bacterium]|nr:hypothetical protein [Flavobacteriia bacterium]